MRLCAVEHGVTHEDEKISTSQTMDVPDLIRLTVISHKQLGQFGDTSNGGAILLEPQLKQLDPSNVSSKMMERKGA